MCYKSRVNTGGREAIINQVDERVNLGINSNITDKRSCWIGRGDLITPQTARVKLLLTEQTSILEVGTRRYHIQSA